jgi:hypothetical protein
LEHIYADTIVSAQIINSIVRIRLGLINPSENPEDKNIKAEEFAEILLPISGFTDLANACNKIAQDLIDRGLLNRGQNNDPKIVENK